MAIPLLKTKLYVPPAQADLVRDHVSEIVHRQAMRADLAEFESPEFHDRLHRARVDASHRPVALLENLGTLLQNGLTLVAMAAVLIPPMALLVGWVVLCSGVLSLATVSVAFGGYMSGLVPALPPQAATATATCLDCPTPVAGNIRGAQQFNGFGHGRVDLPGAVLVVLVNVLQFQVQALQDALFRVPEIGRASCRERV